MKKYSLLPLLFLLAACATPKVAVNPRADFSTVKRVAVLSFSGPKGELAADLMTQSLLENGADVIERQRLDSVMREQSLTASSAFDPSTAKQIGKLLGVDALFVGTVAESTPQSSYIVSQSANPQSNVTQVSGGTIYSEGSVLGMPNSQLLSTTANVSLLSRMVDVQTGSIMWSASMTYEGFDIPSAMTGITDAFIRSLSPIWPGLYKVR
ncbi:MAG: CsgG/HfaB family protein [Elusimicrobiales bacterium]|nr:CsgG/HfaB family protein [Elusimicrobiales bacterium]